MKIKCLNPIARVGLDQLDAGYEIAEELDQADAVLVRSAAMHDLKLPEDLLAVARAGAGVNNIPMDACAEKGVVVFNTPGANANGVKELVLAGMLLAARDIAGGMNWVKENSGDENISKAMEKAKKNFAGTEIQGKKLGVIGLGAIGVLVANAATSLGMDVYGCDPYLNVEHALSLSRHVHLVKDPSEIYQNCNYITIHVPLTEGTRKMVNQEALAQMKGAVLLNFARDLLVDEEALEEAIVSGSVRRYVTDFPNPRTAAMEGVIAMPHLGASTEESEDNCAVMAVRELKDYLENGNIENSVNFPSCSLGGLRKAARITVLHRNMPNVISSFTSLCGQAGVNIADMISKSRGEYAYAMFDLDTEPPVGFLTRAQALEGVLRVRILQ